MLLSRGPPLAKTGVLKAMGAGMVAKQGDEGKKGNREATTLAV